MSLTPADSAAANHCCEAHLRRRYEGRLEISPLQSLFRRTAMPTRSRRRHCFEFHREGHLPFGSLIPLSADGWLRTERPANRHSKTWSPAVHVSASIWDPECGPLGVRASWERVHVPPTTKELGSQSQPEERATGARRTQQEESATEYRNFLALEIDASLRAQYKRGVYPERAGAPDKWHKARRGGVRNTRNHFVTASSSESVTRGLAGRGRRRRSGYVSQKDVHAHTIVRGAAAKKRSAATAWPKPLERRKTVQKDGRHTGGGNVCVTRAHERRGAEHVSGRKQDAGLLRWRQETARR
ncbi:hypothetical protein HPB51_005964 [Rhipicephalus microplus]|uniref:Uncharacterized protein n=1 Tax=Rhipicephalus microplus TaxID=6941 RepID=A0A9J6E6R2_RHIMP|nr:hypothetical protein HPB51_005964 [Rhipicephalus microplus]